MRLCSSGCIALRMIHCLQLFKKKKHQSMPHLHELHHLRQPQQRHVRLLQHPQPRHASDARQTQTLSLRRLRDLTSTSKHQPVREQRRRDEPSPSRPHRSLQLRSRLTPIASLSAETRMKHQQHQHRGLLTGVLARPPPPSCAPVCLFRGLPRILALRQCAHRVRRVRLPLVQADARSTLLPQSRASAARNGCCTALVASLSPPPLPPHSPLVPCPARPVCPLGSAQHTTSDARRGLSLPPLPLHPSLGPCARSQRVVVRSGPLPTCNRPRRDASPPSVLTHALHTALHVLYQPSQRRLSECTRRGAGLCRVGRLRRPAARRAAGRFC